MPAESECIDTHTQLRGVSTDFDGVPLVGTLVETLPARRHAEQETEVRSVVRRKVESQARRTMDSITERAPGRGQSTVAGSRAEAPGCDVLDPQVISAETSEQRLTDRMRMRARSNWPDTRPAPATGR